MAKRLFDSIQEELEFLKKERNAIILAHNYQAAEIQDVADIVGDSLKLAQEAVKTSAKVILFAGVHFMAETASVLNPDKTVLLPDMAAGCSLADMVKPEDVRAWKKDHPDGVVVCYVNTSVAVKAECDYCCTSSNAQKIVEHIPADKEILFVPDFFLGGYIKKLTGRNITLWSGYCPTHALITPEVIAARRSEHPNAEYIVHPECGCTTKTMHLADKVLSTEGMVQYVNESPSSEFIVATETGILHRMRQQNAEKEFFAASEQAVCPFMKVNTLEKCVRALERMSPEVKIPADLAARARIPLERMISIC